MLMLLVRLFLSLQNQPYNHIIFCCCPDYIKESFPCMLIMLITLPVSVGLAGSTW